MNDSLEVLRQPLFWLVVGQLLIGSPLLRLIQLYVISRNPGWRGRVIEVLVLAVLIPILLFGPLLVGGFPLAPTASAEQDAMFWGLIVGALLAWPIRSYVTRWFNRRLLARSAY